MCGCRGPRIGAIAVCDRAPCQHSAQRGRVIDRIVVRGPPLAILNGGDVGKSKEHSGELDLDALKARRSPLVPSKGTIAREGRSGRKG